MSKARSQQQREGPAAHDPRGSSVAELMALVDAAVDAIVVIDARGVIQLFSRAAERLFGYKQDDVLGENVSCLMPEPYRDEHDAYIGAYLDTRKPKIIGIGRRVEARRKNGEVFPVDLSVGEIRDSHPPRFVGIIRDLSEIVRIEQERIEAEAEAEHLRDRITHVSRLSLMGEMATGIAHEVNQPLTAIATYARACRRLLSSTDEQDRAEVSSALDQIADQALRAGEVIRRLRAFVRHDNRQRRVYDVNVLVTEVLRLADIDVRTHNVPLQVELADERLSTMADGVQVQQVVLNLVHNGIEATAQASRNDPVTVRTRRHARGRIAIEVVDRGVGVAPEVEKNLFKPFFTTKPSGMGVGLSICRSIVVSHGGELWFQRNPDRGTTFAFTLPEWDGDDDDSDS